MAEFALGLTKMAVAGTVSRVKSAIEEEGKLRVGVEDDLVFITGEFEMMQAFLNVANAERANNQVVRTWVRQLRDLAFDVENCVEFVVHLDKAARWDWVRRLASPLICMARPPLPLDVAVAEIKRLKTRVEDISQRNRRYNLISDSGSNSKASVSVHSPAPELMLPATGHTGAASAFHILSKVWEDAGKHRGTSDLRMLIMSKGNDLDVISLWGSPGAAADLGVTHVIGEAYNDPEICKEFKTRAWIKLMHPFDADEFLKSLLTQVYVSSNRENIAVDFRKKMKAAVAMEDELMQQLRQQKYLVIIEELSTLAEWDAIRIYLPDSTNGSRIVVATQQLGPALSCTGKPYQVSDLRQFPDGQSLCAFNKNRHRDEEENEAGISSSRKEEARDWIDKFKLLGRDDEVERLVGSSPGVLSVWGIAAVGKSALVRYVYSLQMLRRPYIGESVQISWNGNFAAFSWVDVTHPFNLVEFSRCLLLDFHSDDLEAKETASIGMMEGQDPIQGCCRFLRENECIVVINGLQSTHDWNLIKAAFLSKPTKCRIYVITTEASVAAHCTDDEEDIVNVKGLEPDVALKLLLMKAWGGKKQLSAKGMEFCTLAVAKCGGLPTIIAAVGEYLAEVTNRRIPDDDSLRYLSPFIHDGFMRNLETRPEFHTLKGLFGWMQSYFDACSDELKPCVFYLSIFPLYHRIRRKRLVRRWIAEGYSRDTTSAGSSTAEENGKKLFSELLNLSIIQQSPDNKIMCQVNGFFREYIISRPMEDNLVFELEGHCKLNSQRIGQHLTISDSWDRDEAVFESIDLSRLRSLTVFGEWMSFFVSNNINMRLLRVLDLEDASGVTDGDIEQIVKALPRLKFFSLRGCKDITHLPDSFGGLRQLQTLDVKGTSIVTLPRVIVELHKLQYICAGSAGVATTPPEADGASTSKAPTAASTETTPPEADGASTSNPPTAASTATTPPEADGASTSNPPTAASTATTPPEVDDASTRNPTTATTPPETDGAITSNPPTAASTATTPPEADGASTSNPPTATTPPADPHVVSTSQPAVPAEGDDADHTSSTLAPWKSRAHNLVLSCNWLSKKMKLRRRPRFDGRNGGVEVPAAGIGQLTALHTLGVVHVTSSGKAVLRELLKLTQLRKLGLSGINRKNWVEFCDTISGHGNLESLSVRLDEEEDVCSLSDIKKPPKTLKSLKLYGGNVHISPAGMKQLDGLTKVDFGDHELTVSTQEDIDSLMEVPCRDMFRRICIKPIQDGDLRYGRWENNWSGKQFRAATVLKIDCSSHKLTIVFGDWLSWYVEVLLVHCSATESSLELSEIHELRALEEVRVKGSYSDKLKQHLQQKVNEHWRKPVLKFDGEPN